MQATTAFLVAHLLQAGVQEDRQRSYTHVEVVG